MRRFIAVTVAAALLVAIGAIPALAAAPRHDTISGTEIDADFCGTGETVIMSVKGAFNGWDDKAFGHIQTTWTNPENGVAIVDSFSGGGTISFIDDGDGAYTLVITRVGQPFRMQYVNGPLILQDSGEVIAYDHFDADNNYLGTDVVFIAGPHPGVDVNWCDLMIELLDL